MRDGIAEDLADVLQRMLGKVSDGTLLDFFPHRDHVWSINCPNGTQTKKREDAGIETAANRTPMLDGLTNTPVF